MLILYNVKDFNFLLFREIDRYCMDHHLMFLNEKEKLLIINHIYKHWLHQQGRVLFVVRPNPIHFRNPRLLMDLINYIPIQFERVLFRMTRMSKDVYLKEVDWIEVTREEFRIQTV